MNTLTRSHSRPIRFTPTAMALRLLNALVAADQRYRAKRKLAETEDFRLQDMGLMRDDANAAFYQRFGNRAADLAPVNFQTRLFR